MASRSSLARVAVSSGAVAIALLVLLLWLLVPWLPSARAARGELWMDSGALLLRYARAEHVDAPRTLHVNGLALRMTSGSTRDPSARVLDFFHERCRAAGFGPVRGLAQFAGARADGPAFAALARALEPIVRIERRDQGFVGCLDPRAGQLAWSDWLERLRAVARSSDVAELGDLRFAWTMREADRTAYVAVWSAGALPIARAFPAYGDAPGRDAEPLPRPASSRRVLSAFVQDAAPLLVGYRAERAATLLEAGYRRQLVDGGFAVREARATPRGRAFVIGHGGAAHAIAVVSAAGAAASTLTLLPLR